MDVKKKAKPAAAETAEQTQGAAAETVTLTKDQIKDKIFELKESLAEVKSEFKKFRKAHGIRDIEKVKEPKIIAEFNDHQAKVDIIQSEIDALNAQKPAKGGGSRGSYAYGQVVDPETKAERAATKAEMKKWRTKARKQAKKDGITAQQVPWDPNFLIRAPKAEKPAKEEKAPKAEKVAKTETVESKPEKKKRREVEDDD